MGKLIRPSDTPFTTSNALLAYCLHLAGVTWEDDTHPVKVLYSPEILRKFGGANGQSFYQGWNYDIETVNHAHKAGRRGHVVYVFKRSPRLRPLLKAYKDQVTQLETSTGFLHEYMQKLAAEFPALDPDVGVLRLAYVMLKMRMPFMELWRHQVPIMLMPNTGKVRRSRQMVNTKDGLREADVVETAGFKLMSTNASEKTRKALGYHERG